MSFSAAVLRAMLEAHAPPDATGLVVAVSGGMDSACLATALAQLGAPFRRLPVRAVHVDHGLQAAAAEFRRACVALCRRLAMPLSIIDVVVEVGNGVSMEAAARDARYRGLAQQLAAGECLLTAHHAADQAETLLLQLLRGAGSKGLSAMPPCRALGSGWHLRPLLETSQRDLLSFAEAAGIGAVSDPMNADLRFDRAYLRAQVWPLLLERWPGAATALSRSARHLAEAQELLDESASRDVQQLTDGDGLSVTGLRVLPALRRLNALRYWLCTRAAILPSTARLTEALRQIIDADADHLPAVVWGELALRRYRDRLLLTAAKLPQVADDIEWVVAPDSVLALGDGLGSLRWSWQAGGLGASSLPSTVIVGRRRGGETLKPHRRASTRSVQHLCQSLGVLPWMRDALPLVYAGETLIAVGDLWQDARWCVAGDGPGLGIVWEDSPSLV